MLTADTVGVLSFETSLLKPQKFFQIGHSCIFSHTTCCTNGRPVYFSYVGDDGVAYELPVAAFESHFAVWRRAFRYFKYLVIFVVLFRSVYIWTWVLPMKFGWRLELSHRPAAGDQQLNLQVLAASAVIYSGDIGAGNQLIRKDAHQLEVWIFREAGYYVWSIE